jgi:hypothetical protein
VFFLLLDVSTFDIYSVHVVTGHTYSTDTPEPGSLKNELRRVALSSSAAWPKLGKSFSY